jgi:geranylgeranyl diphosphate synthase, type I
VAVDLDAELRRLGEVTDGYIRDAVRRHMTSEAAQLTAMLEYHLGWRGPDLQLLPKPAPAGKKLRPGLVLLASQAVGGEMTQASHASAAAVELIHNFSLVHDDIQDHSELRRHRPTVWALWGMPQAINVGDALFALAQVVLAEAGTSLAAQLTVELNRAALGLAEGQFLDIDLQAGKTPPTLEAYEAMISRKTGVLFACACRMGAMAAGASNAQSDAYAAYGMQLGIAFQEQDDLLGVWGLSADTGKPDAADIIERKRGLPAAMALGRSDTPPWLSAAYSEERAMQPATVDRIIAHFDALDVRSAVETRVHERYQQALACLDVAEPREPARSYLAAVCEALVSRRT